ncbi:MAG: Ig-like domain-containing protein [Solirubrobacterales bacterium]
MAALLVIATSILPAESAWADQSSSRSRPLLAGRIDSGSWHSCAIAGDGTVRCWGYGEFGELGYGNTKTIGDDETPASVGPVDLGAGRTASAITVGEFHTCAILDNGTVRCWGNGGSGKLGYGNTNSIGDNETPGSAGPLDLGAGRTAVSLSAGDNHTCAILDNGTVRCWGANGYGQLGYGNTTVIGDNETPAAAGPVDLGAGRTAVEIAAGMTETCALLDNGTVRCWGNNSSGQLGTGGNANIGDNETPGSVAPVDFGAGRTAVAISVGYAHACAILDTGGVKCWGSGENGRLGYANTTNVYSPANVGTVDLGAGRTAVAIEAVDNHTCAVLDNGTLLCWGANTYSQLGYTNFGAPVGDNETPGSVGPVNLGSGRNAVGVTGGKYFTCAQLDNGTVRCWGESYYGQLGYGNQNTVGDNETPGLAGPVDLGTGHGVLETTTGTNHSCALFDTGVVRCWGLNSSGQLGDGNTANIGDNENPGAGGIVDLGGRSAVEIAAGEAHTCALLDDGTVRCWGKGASGQLGYGNTENIGDNETPGSVAPVYLAGESAVAIAAGASHTCALMTTGTVRCWGLGTNGRLGYGNTENIGDTELPGEVAPVVLGASAVAISAGAAHTCARLADGTLRCWGLGTGGRLGYASTESIGDNETPSTAGAVNVGGSAVAIAAGGIHTCSRLTDGTVRCWGSGLNGRLGYANTTAIGDNETPSSAGAVNIGRTTAMITAGGNHTCARLTDGTVRCWGLATSGQLGYGNTENIGDNETPSTTGPVDLGTGRSAIDISAGGSHTCAALDNGTVRCWGLATSGQLGYGNTENVGDNETPGSLAALDFVDDPPVAVNDSATVVEDVATTIEVLANDTDVDGGPKSIASKTSGAHGTVTINGAGASVTYTPEANYCGSDSFSYELAPGGSKATVSVTVSCVDDPPVAVNDSAAMSEDASAQAIGVLANDTDIDGGPKEVVSKTNSTHGTVTITGGGAGLTYAPEANYCGSDSFTYTLNGGSTATVSVTISCVDDPPVAINDSATVSEDASATSINVLANDTDVDGGPKEVVSKTNPAHGTVSITGGGTGLTYAPEANYCGSDSFTYTLNGGSTGNVSVSVTCVDDPPVAINDSTTVSEDASATAIDVLANDTDIDGGPKSIVGKTNGTHGNVAITGEGSGLTYTPEANYCGSDSFTYELTPGGSKATVSVTISCIDDPPLAVNDAATLAEDASATSINVLANDTDIDGGPKEIAAKTNGAHGTVAITSGGTGLTYTPGTNYCGADSFTYTLNGGSTATVSITITCVDDPPVAVDDSASLAEDAIATPINVLANDTDIDGGPKTIATKTNGAHGTVAITGEGTGLAYLPDPNYCGPDSFTYELAPGGSKATVSITVSCIDDPPVAINDSATVGEDALATTIDVLANDTDVDGGPKSIVSKSNGSHGAVAITGGGAALSYTPDPNYCGSDSFTYELAPGGSKATVSITVSCVDDPPAAVNDSASVTEDSSASAIDVLANDTDIDSGPKAVISKTNGVHGAVAIVGGGTGITYTPDPNYCGPDFFTYALNGGAEATVSLFVGCVDDPPVAVNDSATVSEDAPPTTIDLLANDTDIDGGPTSVASKTNGTHGTVTIGSGGTEVSYTPEANYCGSDSFTYTLNGGSTATVSITVSCLDDPPVAVNDSTTIPEDASSSAIDVLANDADVDGGPKSIASKTNGAHGTVAIEAEGAELSYTPNANYCGPDSFTYELAPGGSKATVSITVSCVDDPPVAANDSATVTEDASAQAIEVLTNDTDIDGGAKEVTAKTNGAHGTVAITGGGTGLTYTPNANYCGPDSFSYTLNGGSMATVSITVSCVDDPPVAVSDSATVTEDASATAIDVLANDTDPDGGPKEVTAKTNGAHGTVTITGEGTGLAYLPDRNYCGSDSFTYTLNGGSQATVSITVSCVDDPPAAVNDSASVAEDSSATAIEVLANDTDIDGGPKSIAEKTGANHGAVAIVGGGTGITYTPDPNYCGPDFFAYSLNGGSEATVSITVSCVDDPPVAIDDSASLNEGASAQVIDVLANDTDIDGGPKSIASKTNGAHGTVAIIGGGAGLTYTPDAGYCGSDSFTYTLNGGSRATVSVTVSCVDDPPVAVNDATTVTEDASATAIDILANDTDPDGGPKTITAKTNGSHGIVSITGAGTGLTYTPDSNYCGPDSFVYFLNGGSNATVSITVSCVDDPPVAVNDAMSMAQDSAATPIDVLANDADPDAGPKAIAGATNGAHGTVAIIGSGASLTYAPDPGYCGSDFFTYTLNGGAQATVSITVNCVAKAPPNESGGSSSQNSSSTTITTAPSSGPVVNVTPGVGVLSGRRRPRIAIKGAYAFFTLTCTLTASDCVGTVMITATVPSPTLGPTMQKVPLVKGHFRIGAGRSVLVRARLTHQGLEVLETKQTLRGVATRMAIVDAKNNQRGAIQVNLVRRPKASLLPGGGG